tara:strand:+ start:7092 stop:7334 length:243 start_codon:yes stop_codon:yes gene_type:complete
MKKIYKDIIFEGKTSMAKEQGEKALEAGEKIEKMVSLFPEMLEMLKRIQYNTTVGITKATGLPFKLSWLIEEAKEVSNDQ